jgi:adenosine deaminase CECR1
MSEPQAVAAPAEERDVSNDSPDNVEEDLGIPSLDEPFLQKYMDGRDALIAQEKQQRSDHAFKTNMTPMAAEAAATVSAIRFQEQQIIWTHDFEDEVAKKEGIEVFPGMMFNLAKDRMEKSKLWQIVRKMPKGALLHCHIEAMGDLDWLIEEAFSTEGICIAADVPLDSSASLQNSPFIFRHVKSPSAAESQSIWSSSYVANESIPINVAATNFPNGGKEGFIRWLKSRVTITRQESLDQVCSTMSPSSASSSVTCYKVCSTTA